MKPDEVRRRFEEPKVWRQGTSVLRTSRFFLGIWPDYVVQVGEVLLREKDGPMLKHGLQGMHNARLVVPRKPSARPAPSLRKQRWGRFLKVA